MLRNYLLDARFQLKYTGMVVLVTIAVAAVFGTIAYRYSKGQTQILLVQTASQPNLTDEDRDFFERSAQEEDRKVLWSIVGGVAIFAFVLGITGILVTHRVVGPAFKIKKLLNDVAKGHLRVDGRLRRKDELQDVFSTFERMVFELRGRQLDEIAELEKIIDAARHAQAPDDVLKKLDAFRERMLRALD